MYNPNFTHYTQVCITLVDLEMTMLLLNDINFIIQILLL